MLQCAGIHSIKRLIYDIYLTAPQKKIRFHLISSVILILIVKSASWKQTPATLWRSCFTKAVKITTKSSSKQQAAVCICRQAIAKATLRGCLIHLTNCAQVIAIYRATRKLPESVNFNLSPTHFYATQLMSHCSRDAGPFFLFKSLICRQSSCFKASADSWTDGLHC